MSLRLPFTPGSSLADGFHVLAAVGGGPIHPFQVDTGSVGILVPRSILGPKFQDFDPSVDTTFGFISSGNLYHGQWVEVPVILGVPEDWDGTGDFATAVIEVFAVDRPITFSGGVLGIGFGIEEEANGGSARNPFLHLSTSREMLTPSYIIGQWGIDVGLTLIALDGFNLLPLESNTAGDDWVPPTCVLSLEGKYSVNLPILIDTGISEMLLFVSNEDRPADLASFSTLPDGVTVGVSIPVAGGRPALAYQFIVGSAHAPMAPTTVQWRHGRGVNTGRNIFACTDYLFDAAVGQIGFRIARRT